MTHTTTDRFRIPPRRRRGFALVSLMLAIGVTAVFLIGALAIYQRIQTSNRTSELQSLLTAISSSAVAIWGPSAQYDTDMEGAVISGGSIPPSAVTGTGNTRAIKNPFGGEINIKGGNLAGNNRGRFFTVEVTDLPEEVCETVLSSFIRSDGIHQFKVGTGRGNGLDPSDAGTTVARVTQICTDADSNTISVVYRG